MRLGGLVSAGAILAMMLGGTALARSTMDVNGPADLPPPSYKGRQFVDSAGCVFVRAGFGDAVRWVPRVSRDRQHLCGYKPTFGSGAPTLDVARSAPVAEPPPASAPVPTRVAAPVVAAPALPAPRPAETPAPTSFSASVPETPAASPVAPARAPSISRVAPAQPKAARATAPSVFSPTPQAAKPAAPRVAAAPDPVVSRTAEPAPRAERVYGTSFSKPAEERQVGAPMPTIASRMMTPPQPARPQAPARVAAPPVAGTTLSGYVSPYAKPGYVAPTQQVAAYPVQRNSAQAAAQRAAAHAAANCAYQSPYTDRYDGTAMGCVPQGQAMAPSSFSPSAAVVATKPPAGGYKPAFEDGRLNPYRGPRTLQGDYEMGQLWTNEVPAKLVTAKTPARKRILVAPAPVQPQARLSSKSLPGAAPKAANGARYVQVGTFGDPANAEGVKSRLRAMGLPVATSRLTKGGRTLQIVLAGPFTSGADLGRALGAARSAGFGDAFAR